jgi:hypothetical protein
MVYLDGLKISPRLEFYLSLHNKWTVAGSGQQERVRFYLYHVFLVAGVQVVSDLLNILRSFDLVVINCQEQVPFLATNKSLICVGSSRVVNLFVHMAEH